MTARAIKFMLPDKIQMDYAFKATEPLEFGDDLKPMEIEVARVPEPSIECGFAYCVKYNQGNIIYNYGYTDDLELDIHDLESKLKIQVWNCIKVFK